MRPAEITDEAVIAAGEQLLAAGKTISGWALREAVGGRGQTKRLMSVWQQHAGDKGVATPAPVTLPPAVAESVAAARESLGACLDGLVCQIYRSVVDIVEARHREELERLQAARNMFTEEIAQAESAVEAADRRERELQDRIVALEKRVAEVTRESAVLGERLRALHETAAKELDRERADRIAAEGRANAAVERAVAAEAKVALLERNGRPSLARTRAKSSAGKSKLSRQTAVA